MLKRIGDFGMTECCHGTCSWCQEFAKGMKWQPSKDGICMKLFFDMISKELIANPEYHRALK